MFCNGNGDVRILLYQLHLRDEEVRILLAQLHMWDGYVRILLSQLNIWDRSINSIHFCLLWADLGHFCIVRNGDGFAHAKASENCSFLPNTITSVTEFFYSRDDVSVVGGCITVVFRTNIVRIQNVYNKHKYCCCNVTRFSTSVISRRSAHWISVSEYNMYNINIKDQEL